MTWIYRERNALCPGCIESHQMIRTSLWLVGLLLCFLFMLQRVAEAVPPMASMDMIGDVEVKQLPVLSSMRSLHGYMEYRFSLTNTLPTRSRHVRLTIDGSHQRSHHVRDTTRSVVVGPKSRVELALYMPSLNLSASRVDVLVDHGTFRGSVSLQHGYRYYYAQGAKEVSLLADPKAGVNSLVCDTLLRDAASFNAGKKSYQKIRYLCRAADVPMQQWSDSWLAYGRFDGVIVTSSEWTSVSTSIRDALQHYVGNGGTLTILGSLEVPKHWITGQTVSRSPLEYHLGFGKILVYPEASVMAGILSEQAQILADETHHSLLPWKDILDPVGANTLFPVVDNVRIPTRGIFLLMLLFCVLVGPLSLRWLRRKQKPILILVTVPVLSLLTCVLIFGYAVLTEGWSGHVRTASVTIFDQRVHQAYSVGWMGFYFPLTPKDGLHLSYDTEVTPQFLVHSWRQSGRGLGMSWDNDQHLSSGWLVSRLPMHVTFRRAQTRRERLVVKRQSSQSIEVTNGLGAKILNLWVADAEGKIYHSSSTLEAGVRQVLSRSAGSSVEEQQNVANLGIQKIRRMTGKSWLDLRKTLMATPERFLLKNTYIAEMESSPFVESGVLQAASQRHESVVFGILKDGTHGS